MDNSEILEGLQWPLENWNGKTVDMALFEEIQVWLSAQDISDNVTNLAVYARELQTKWSIKTHGVKLLPAPVREYINGLQTQIDANQNAKEEKS